MSGYRGGGAGRAHKGGYDRSRRGGGGRGDGHGREGGDGRGHESGDGRGHEGDERDGGGARQAYESYWRQEDVIAAHAEGRLLRGRYRGVGGSTEGFLPTDEPTESDVLLSKWDRNRSVHGDVVYVMLHDKSKWKPLVNPFLKALDSMEETDTRDVQHDTSPPNLQRCGRVVYIELSKRIFNHVIRLVPNKKGGEGLIDFHVSKNCGFVKGLPLDKRMPHLLIPTRELTKLGFPVPGHLPNGTYFEASIDNWKETDSLPQGVLLRVLGKIGETEAEEVAAMTENTLASHMEAFSQFAENEAMEIVEKTAREFEDEVQRRHDLRGRRIFTIDPSTARDLDDAVGVTATDEANVYEVSVSIADVSHFVTPGSHIDQTASERCTTVYLPRLCYPMLPRSLCDELCSLHPESDKFCMTVMFDVDAKSGEVKNDPKFCKSVIRSCCRFSYGQVQAILEEKVDPDAHWPKIFDGHSRDALLADLRVLEELTTSMRKRRFSSGGLELNNPKVCIVFKSDKHKEAGIDKQAEERHKVTATAGQPHSDQPQSDHPHSDQPHSDQPHSHSSVIDHIAVVRDDSEDEGVGELSEDETDGEVSGRGEVGVEGCTTGAPLQVGADGEEYVNHPTGFRVDVRDESHSMIEELMLEANRTVAVHLAKYLPGLAVLRCHPPPEINQLVHIQSYLKGVGIELDICSAGSINKSLLEARQTKGRQVGQAVELMLQNPMNLAEYCVHQTESSAINKHFALNFDLYTHYTSPIRRYPDIMVHRQLSEVIANQQTVLEVNEAAVEHLKEICQVCNEKKLLAKSASESCTAKFFVMYLAALEKPFCWMGTVMKVLDRSIQVALTLVQRTATINFEYENTEMTRATVFTSFRRYMQFPIKGRSQNQYEATFVWKRGGDSGGETVEQKIKLFSRLPVYLYPTQMGLELVTIPVPPWSRTYHEMLLRDKDPALSPSELGGVVGGDKKEGLSVDWQENWGDSSDSPHPPHSPSAHGGADRRPEVHKEASNRFINRYLHRQ
eukprot:GHVN01036138.1.p1 GENE.GHVN01036138.1~~GHVN01036138.1.p1  ORF type:complete len:1014 (+),score=222.12 GHVN01036138.1:311-3352(+)